MSKLSDEAEDYMSFTGGPPTMEVCRNLCQEIRDLEAEVKQWEARIAELEAETGRHDAAKCIAEARVAELEEEDDLHCIVYDKAVNRIAELESQTKWILAAKSIPSDRREVDTGFLNEKGVIERGFDRYSIKEGFGENVIYWKYQTEWPEATKEVGDD